MRKIKLVNVAQSQTDFRGFYSDQTIGNTLEVVCVWNDEILAVEHIPVSGPIPPDLPGHLLEPLLSTPATLREPVRVSDTRTGIRYYVRRVGDPQPIDEKRPLDWSVPASMVLVVMVGLGILTVLATTRLLATEDTESPEAALSSHPDGDERKRLVSGADGDLAPPQDPPRRDHVVRRWYADWQVKYVVPGTQLPPAVPPPASRASETD